MIRLLFFVSLLAIGSSLFAQNPHGPDLKMNCTACHSSAGWEIGDEFWQNFDPYKPVVSRTTGVVRPADTIRFHHNKTKFDLRGRHAVTDCRACHTSLVFTDASTECVSCHVDIHQQTVGADCARCHHSNNWLVDNITDLHQENGFPLTGVHQAVSCEECHQSASALQFNRIGNDCISCHRPDYDAAANPNHQQGGFSTDCLECHDVFTPGWGTDKVKHDFFPLTKGHEITDCAQCHTNGYAGTPTQCVACHTTDYNQSINPSHTALNLPMDCATCHTTQPGWEPASFDIHNNYYVLNGAHANVANDCAGCHNGDYNNTPNTCAGCHTSDYNATTNPNHTTLQFSTDCASCHAETAWTPATFNHDAQYFPIYSGKHKGEWSQCTDCHTNPSDYAIYTCTTCHTNPETNNQHNGIGGYVYQSNACLGCHPTGDASTGFDHNTTAFPLTGAHLSVACLQCHTQGYQGTPTACAACHITDFNQTTNPNHVALNLSTDCATCHTTTPGWEPATFAVHNNYHPLNGAHASIANNCVVCHNGNYNNTPNTCFGCHLSDYNAANNPNHASALFPTDCATCHSETAWEPSSFDHDQQYFPIFSGKHNGEWDKCNECHTTPNNFTAFSCIDCHEHDNPAQLANDHQGVSGYSYTSSACFTCHPNGN